MKKESFMTPEDIESLLRWCKVTPQDIEQWKRERSAQNEERFSENERRNADSQN